MSAGRDPLLPAARPAARQRLLRAGRRRHQGLQGALRRAAAHPGRAATAPVRAGAGAREPARARTAGRLAAQVPRQRTRSDESARAGARLRVGARQHPERAQHQLRLERAVQGRPRRGRSGSRARARHQLASLEPDHQCRPVRHERHAAARQHLPRRHRRPRDPRGARQARHLAQPDARHPRRQDGAAGADGEALL